MMILNQDGKDAFIIIKQEETEKTDEMSKIVRYSPVNESETDIDLNLIRSEIRRLLHPYDKLNII